MLRISSFFIHISWRNFYNKYIQVFLYTYFFIYCIIWNEYEAYTSMLKVLMSIINRFLTQIEFFYCFRYFFYYGYYGMIIPYYYDFWNLKFMYLFKNIRSLNLVIMNRYVLRMHSKEFLVWLIIHHLWISYACSLRVEMWEENLFFNFSPLHYIHERNKYKLRISMKLSLSL